MKLDADEKKLLESVDRGGWKSAGGGKRERSRYARYAKATFRKDRRLNIRLSSKDLEAMRGGNQRAASCAPRCRGRDWIGNRSGFVPVALSKRDMNEKGP